MSVDKAFVSAIYQGWHAYHETLKKALAPLQDEQLALRAAPQLRSVREIATHIIGARARWFSIQFGEGGEAFKGFGTWDRLEAKVWSAEELLQGLDGTWKGIQEAIARWTPEEWEQTWPGEDDDEPEVITRHWVIWHLIEHDIYHGGQISAALAAHDLPSLAL